MRLRRLFSRHKQTRQPPLQGEEYELAEAQRAAQKERDKYAESLLEKAAHARYPFLKDPFE
jgi:hypothetical protein